MNTKEIEKIRTEKIIGKTINLVPIEENFINEIVLLRNQQNAKYYLSQNFDLTYDSQLKWLNDNYFNDFNQVGFVVLNKKDEVVGVNYLYDYRGNSIEKGRQVFNMEKNLEGPYALECELILMDLAFERIGVSKIVATVKDDNDKVLSFNKRLGFKIISDIVIRNKNYNCIELKKENREYDKFHSLIDNWVKRKL